MKWRVSEDAVLQEFDAARQQGVGALEAFFKEQWGEKSTPLLRKKLANALLHHALREADAAAFGACRTYCHAAYDGYKPYDPRTGLSMFVELANGHSFEPGTIERHIADQEFAAGDEDLALRKGKGSIGTDKRRFLHFAIESGHAEAFEWIVSKGGDLDGFDPNSGWDTPAPSETALTTAVRLGDLDKVEVLLCHGANPNVFIAQNGQRKHPSPLEYALQRDDWECVKMLSHSPHGVWPSQLAQMSAFANEPPATLSTVDTVERAKCWVAIHAREWMAARDSWANEAQKTLRWAQEAQFHAIALETQAQELMALAKDKTQRDLDLDARLQQQFAWTRWIGAHRKRRQNRLEQEHQTDASSLMNKAATRSTAANMQRVAVKEARDKALRLQACAELVAADPSTVRDKIEQWVKEQGGASLQEPLHGLPLAFMALCLDLAAFDATPGQSGSVHEGDAPNGAASLSIFSRHKCLIELFNGTAALTDTMKAQIAQPLPMEQGLSAVHFCVLFNRLDLLHLLRSKEVAPQQAHPGEGASLPDTVAVALCAGSGACAWDELDHRGSMRHSGAPCAMPEASALCLACAQGDQPHLFEELMRRWEAYELPWLPMDVESAVFEVKNWFDAIAKTQELDLAHAPADDDLDKAQWEGLRHWSILIDRARLLTTLRGGAPTQQMPDLQNPAGPKRALRL